MTKIRVTELGQFYLCPYRFQNEVKEETEAMRKGTKIHKFLAAINKGEPVPSEFLEPEEKAMIQSATTFKGAIIETPLVLSLTPSIVLGGTPDVVVPGESLIHDYKTGWVKYPVKSSPQLFLYYYLYTKVIEKLKKGNLTFEFLRFPEKNELKLSEDKIVKVAEKVIDSFVKDPTLSEPRPNMFCNFCSLAAECPLMHRYLNIEAPLKNQFAANVLRSYISRRAKRIETIGEERVSSEVDLVAIEKKVRKADIAKALEVVPQDILLGAVATINLKKVPDIFVEQIVKEEVRKGVDVKVDITN